MRSALACHDKIVRDAIEANGGYVFKTIGDAFCAAFNTAVEAIQAAIDTQLVLFFEPWEVDPPVRVRMAIHTGVAEARDNDYYGQPVNRVARLLSAGHGGADTRFRRHSRADSRRFCRKIARFMTLARRA